MKDFYHKYSIRIITGTLAIILVVMYIWLSIFTQNAHLSNPIYTRNNVTKIEIQNFIGTVELVTHDDAGFKLEFTNRKSSDPAGYYPLFKMGTDTIATINGRFEPIASCALNIDDENMALMDATINETKDKQFNLKDYPILKIAASKDVILAVERSSIFGTAQNIGGIEFENIICSHFVLDNVANNAAFELKGLNFISANQIGGNLDLAGATNFVTVKTVGGATTYH